MKHEEMKGYVKPGHIRVTLDFTPVAERLPGEGTSAFILVPHISFPYMAYYKDGKWMWCFSVHTVVELEVTHWAEIPTIKEQQ